MEGQAEGVMQGTEPVSTSDSSPESIEQGAQASEGQSQPKSKDYNFRQMRENLSRLENERKAWEAERAGIQRDLQALRQDPKNGLRQLAQSLGVDVKTLIETATEPQEPQVNFDQYEPETAKLLKLLYEKANRVDAIEKWKSEFEQKTQKEQMEFNSRSLQSQFDKDLTEAGFLDKNGQGDMGLIDTLTEAVWAKLYKATNGKPELASIDQYKEARDQIFKGFSAHKNQTLQQTVTKSVPSSGSKNGAATTAKPPMTREQRISFLADMARQNSSWGFDS